MAGGVIGEGGERTGEGGGMGGFDGKVEGGGEGEGEAEGSGEGGGDGADEGGGDGGGEAVSSPQITKPRAVTELSVDHCSVAPDSMTIPMGPVLPQYLVSSILIQS